MRLVDVKATDGSLVNPERVDRVVPTYGGCYLYVGGISVWCTLPAEEVVKALQGHLSGQQVAAWSRMADDVLNYSMKIKPSQSGKWWGGVGITT